MVTLEDIIEEILGREINDEFDQFGKLELFEAGLTLNQLALA